MSQAQVTVSIEYDGGVYLSQPYEFGILPPLILAASKVTGFDLLQLMTRNSAPLAQMLEIAPTLSPTSWLGAKNDVTEILAYLFPLLPSAKIAVSSNDISSLLLKLIEPFIEAPTPLTEADQVAALLKIIEDGRATEQAAPTAPPIVESLGQMVARKSGKSAPIGVTAPATVAPIVESSPTGMDGPPTFTTFQIDAQHAEMAGLFEQI